MKSFAATFEAHVATWCGRFANAPNEWWPKFVYHFTDVQNAASIIKCGKLLSRAAASSMMVNDNAAQSVIASTTDAHKAFVRLYFRPLTPTQWNNEGIRPAGERQLASHCPMPVFFCFDTLQMLSDDATQFSNGNMGSSRPELRYGATEADFLAIPFESVFHSASLSPSERDSVIFHRNAEVLYPTELRLLPKLKMVVCRNAPERQTLLQMLPPLQRVLYREQVRLGFEGLFNRRGTLVESVSGTTDMLHFTFANGSASSGAFGKVSLEFIEDGTKRKWLWEEPWDTKHPLNLRLVGVKNGVARLQLDGCLAFYGPVTFGDQPF